MAALTGPTRRRMPSACNFAIVFAIARREIPARKVSKKKRHTQISLIFCVILLRKWLVLMREMW